MRIQAGLRQSRSAWLGMALLVAAAGLLWLSAYQAPLHLGLALGGDPATQRRSDDAPFLRGFNGSEPPDRVVDPAQPTQWVWWWDALAASGGRSYRWASRQAEVLVPGAGGARYVITALASGPPGGVISHWRAGPGLDYQLALAEGEPRRYRLLAAPAPGGDLRITMTTPGFAAPGDPRDLAFVLYELRIAPADTLLRPPAWPHLGWLTLALGALLTWVWAAGGLRLALILGLLASVGAAYSLAFTRPALTLFTPTVAALAVTGALVTLAAYRAWSTRRPQRVALVALVMAAWAIRVGGMIHPHAIFSDTGLQANKLFEASLGRIFLSTALPTAAGGGVQPYPPGPFLVLLPFTLIFPADHWGRILLVQLGTALLDSLVLAAIALILWRAGLGWRVALLGAATYLIPVTALESFTVGELANLGGQALAIPLIMLLALGVAAPQGSSRFGLVLWPLLGLTVAMSVALLAHSGVTLSVGAMIAVAWTLALVMALQQRKRAIGIVPLSLAAAGGLGLALILFYSAPIYLEALGNRGGGDPSRGMALGTIVAQTVLGLLGVIPPGRRAMAIPTLLSLIALVGLALVWVRRAAQPQAAALRATLIAWWLGTLLSQGLLLVADQGLRWGHFLYPALGLSGGVVLGSLWRRGRAGRTVVILSLTILLVGSLGRWIIHIRDYLH
ncbi:MAG: hypothetical protein AB4911_04680 [Oscillochloridaceae bacterium umkhey_bin13]